METALKRSRTYNAYLRCLFITYYSFLHRHWNRNKSFFLMDLINLKCGRKSTYFHGLDKQCTRINNRHPSFEIKSKRNLIVLLSMYLHAWCKLNNGKITAYELWAFNLLVRWHVLLLWCCTWCASFLQPRVTHLQGQGGVGALVMPC